MVNLGFLAALHVFASKGAQPGEGDVGAGQRRVWPPWLLDPMSSTHNESRLAACPLSGVPGRVRAPCQLIPRPVGKCAHLLGRVGQGRQDPPRSAWEMPARAAGRETVLYGATDASSTLGNAPASLASRILAGRDWCASTHADGARKYTGHSQRS